MEFVYNPFFSNNRRYENFESYNENTVFETELDCEQYIIQKGYSVKIQDVDSNYYITPRSHELIMNNKDVILKEQLKSGLNDNDLIPLFAIHESTFSCPVYRIIKFNFVEKQVYEQDIKLEEEKQKKKEEFNKNIENVKNFGNDMVKQWNNSEIKKTAGSFFRDITNRTKAFIEMPTKNEVVNNDYVTDYDLESYLFKNHLIYDKEVDFYMIKTEDGTELIKASRINQYKMDIKEGFNSLDPIIKQTLHSFISRYVATPITERVVKKEKYEINSEYLKEGVNKKRFISLEQAEGYVNLINRSISINEIKED